jgi:hypothetical protein
VKLRGRIRVFEVVRNLGLTFGLDKTSYNQNAEPMKKASYYLSLMTISIVCSSCSGYFMNTSYDVINTMPCEDKSYNVHIYRQGDHVRWIHQYTELGWFEVTGTERDDLEYVQYMLEQKAEKACADILVNVSFSRKCRTRGIWFDGEEDEEYIAWEARGLAMVRTDRYRSKKEQQRVESANSQEVSNESGISQNDAVQSPSKDQYDNKGDGFAAGIVLALALLFVVGLSGE